MAFTLHTSHRLESLFDALATQLADDPLPPLESETILVPGPGIARWLQQRLAERLGIAAGFRMPFFGAFLRELIRPGDDDPFRREVLVFRLWRLLDTGDQQALAPAIAYCKHDVDGQKRLQLCERLAACFDDYQLYRDDYLQAFARGETPAAAGPHAAWQGTLWRALLEDAGLARPAAAPTRPRRAPRGDATPLMFPELAEAMPRPAVTAHRIDNLRQLLRDGERARPLLPTRLWVFGSVTMPPAFVRLLQQMAALVPVHLFVPQPTPHFVGDLRARAAPGDNYLLARLGTESREFADLLLELETARADGPGLERQNDPLEELGEPSAPTPTLLACVQHDIVHAHDRGADERFVIDADDDSLRVHDCHSPHRELEVVRDQILRAFAADATLMPHDVLVLVPDIDRYAPYAHAVFGPTAKELPFRVVDRSPARELPICRATLALLRLARDRLTTFDVLHTLETPAIQQRFKLFPSDIPTLRHLCHQAGIRWGIDAETRAQRFDLPAFADNSWRQGLERLVLGLATGPTDDVVLDHLPVGGVTESRTELLQRFLGFLDTLFAQFADLTASRRLAAWADRLDALVATMFQAGDGDDEAALQHLQAASTELRRVAIAAQNEADISSTVFGDWLSAQLDQGAGARGFLGGPVTIAAMQPLRAVPVKCLFLCGLDDQSFPHQDRPSPFDLIAAQPRPGDRSRRLDDRQLFLDLLLAARQKLHLTYVGHSVKDNSVCTPSILLVELLEYLDRTCVAPEGFDKPHAFVSVQHPLQPWNPRYAGEGDARLFTFARVPCLPAVRSSLAPELPWLPPRSQSSVDVAGGAMPLQDLLDFWWHPCRSFLRHTMQVRLRNSDDREVDDEPFLLNSLDRYLLQDVALRSALAGEGGPRDAYAHARASGVLPVGEQGRITFRDAGVAIEELLAHVPPGPRRRVPVTVRGAEWSLYGDLDSIGARAQCYVRATTKLKPKDLLRCWILHLVLSAARADDDSLPSLTLLAVKDAFGTYQPLDPATAHQALEDLIGLRAQGLDQPLLIFEQSSHAYAEALAARKAPEEAMRLARIQWEPKTSGLEWEHGDIEDPDIGLCMRGRDPLHEDLFARLSVRVWRPQLECFQKKVKP